MIVEEIGGCVYFLKVFRVICLFVSFIYISILGLLGDEISCERVLDIVF